MEGEKQTPIREAHIRVLSWKVDRLAAEIDGRCSWWWFLLSWSFFKASRAEMAELTTTLTICDSFFCENCLQVPWITQVFSIYRTPPFTFYIMLQVELLSALPRTSSRLNGPGPLWINFQIFPRASINVLLSWTEPVASAVCTGRGRVSTKRSTGLQFSFLSHIFLSSIAFVCVLMQTAGGCTLLLISPWAARTVNSEVENGALAYNIKLVSYCRSHCTVDTPYACTVHTVWAAEPALASH